jgi:putative methyltransferase (TIGR04325 family)
MKDKISALLKRNQVLSIPFRRRFDNIFLQATHMNLFRGKYPSFEAASKELPTHKHTGYNNENSAQMYDERLSRIHYTDYPVLFWLQQIISKDKSELKVFDYGGHIGVSYYAYQKVIHFPENLKWTTYDVEAVVERGKTVAIERRADRIQFQKTLDKLPDANVFFASGSPQYSPDFFKDIESLLQSKYVLLNMIPCSSEADFYTINNIGTAFCTYRIFSSTSLENHFKKLGYEILDSWTNEGKECDLSYTTDTKVNYKGWYMEKKSL